MLPNKVKRVSVTPVIDHISVSYLDVQPLDGSQAAPLLDTVFVTGMIYVGDGSRIAIQGEMTGDERAELADLIGRVGQRLLATTRRSLGEDEGWTRDESIPRT